MMEQIPLTIAVLALLVGYCHWFLKHPEDFENGYKRMQRYEQEREIQPSDKDGISED